MADNDNPDGNETEMQTDLFGAEPVPAYRPDPDKVRARLYKILAEARAAQVIQWEPTRVSLYRTIIPQMTRWLPENEGAQLRFEFDVEMASSPPSAITLFFKQTVFQERLGQRFFQLPALSADIRAAYSLLTG